MTINLGEGANWGPGEVLPVKWVSVKTRREWVEWAEKWKWQHRQLQKLCCDRLAQKDGGQGWQEGF